MTPPQEQLCEVAKFYSSREVVERMVEWRARPGNARKPHTAMFPCGRGDLTRMGGAACRAAGGCSEGPEQCLVYWITAPFYHAMVPFLVGDRKIYEKTVELKETVAKVKKNAKKNTAWAIEEREALERRLDTTFNILREDYINLIKAGRIKCV